MYVGQPPAIDGCLCDMCHRNATTSPPHTVPVRYSAAPLSLAQLLQDRSHDTNSASSTAERSESTIGMHSTDGTTSAEPSHLTSRRAADDAASSADSGSSHTATDSLAHGWSGLLKGMLGSAWHAGLASEDAPAAQQRAAWSRQLSQVLADAQYMLGHGGPDDGCAEVRLREQRWLQRLDWRGTAGYMVCSLLALLGLCLAVATRKQMGHARERGGLLL